MWYHHTERSVRYWTAGWITSIMEVAVGCGIQSSLRRVNTAYWFSFPDSTSIETTIADIQNVVFTITLASEEVIYTEVNEACYSIDPLGIQGVMRPV